MCEYENLEALFLKLHEDWNDLYYDVLSFSTKNENWGFHVLFLKPGFHIIVRVVPVAPVFSDIYETIGATGTTLTRLWFSYSRPGRPPCGRLVEDLTLKGENVESTDFGFGRYFRHCTSAGVHELLFRFCSVNTKLVTNFFQQFNIKLPNEFVFVGTTKFVIISRGSRISALPP